MKNINTNQGIQNVLIMMGKTFKILEDRERKILRLRYGLEDGRPRTLAELAKIEKISRERVRQIEARAFEKIDLVLKYEE